MNLAKAYIENLVTKKVSIAPLTFFRIGFGLIMFVSILRFILKGWIYSLYIQPRYYFPFYGFEWVKPLGETGMYIVFALLALTSLFIGLGLLYKYSCYLFFLCFTYVELIDKSNYLNHYYFVSIISFLLCLVPAGKSYSLDVRWDLTKPISLVPIWCINSFKFQLAIVYFFAGIAKINSDWLFNAQPLRIWLPVKYDLPVIGSFLEEIWVAYFFSWAGMLYDICIPFLLIWRRTTYYAIAMVLVFHILTSILFPQIGMFPFIMLMAALIFLPDDFHKKILAKLSWLQPATIEEDVIYNNKFKTNFAYKILIIHFIIQILLPLRCLLYPGELFWTEEGYRFSWRVMLMEKAGYAVFTVKEYAGGPSKQIVNSDYLSKQQEKMMATQPDMILQYAKIINEDYHSRSLDPEVRVECYVTLNGRASKLFIDPKVDLNLVKESFAHKEWILPSAKK